MAEQGNLGGPGGNISPRSMPQQGQGYSLGAQVIGSMDVMDDVTIGRMVNSPQRISDLDRSGDTLDSLAPIFPPQNFEVPDISFSNSVSPNVDFNQSLLSSAQMYGNSNTLYSSSPGLAMVGQPVRPNQQQQQSYASMAIRNQQQATYFPSASQSPPGTSSSDDSDDLPLAQLAKRGVTGNTASNAGAVASVASPSAHSTDTTSMEGSPVSGGTPKKAKQSKRKKKKDPNEPQKPVSAYALFFRDTQATIKGHNPSASFGEVSKIVASMWDQLDPEHKDVYKKKTEMAKKQYLKQLAAYRASQVSQSATEEAEKSPSPPGVGSLSIGGMSGTSSFQAGSPPGSNMSVSMTGQAMGQQRPYIQQQSPPHLMQVPPQIMQQQQQQQMQQQLLQQQQMNQTSQSSPSHQQHSPTQQMSPLSGPVYASQPGITSYQPTIVNHNNTFGFSDTDVNMEVNYPQCVRSGCRNHAKENLAWDSEYCSNDCVITHCRDIFKSWVASRSGSNAYPVK